MERSPGARLSWLPETGPDHAATKTAVPPEIETTATPSDAPGALVPVDEQLTVNALGCETEMPAVAEQPAASVTVTEKTPAQTPETAVWPFQAASDQTVETCPFWFKMFKETDPSQAPKQDGPVGFAEAEIVQPAARTVKLQAAEQFFESVTVTE